MTQTLINGTLLSLYVSLFAGLGGALVLFKKHYSRKAIVFLLNMAAGVMLGSSFFTLLDPAISSAGSYSLNNYVFGALITLSVLLGMALIWGIHEILPHTHESVNNQGVVKLDSRTAWLFVIAIAIHKFPEGLAVGVGFAGGEIFNPQALAIGIALQNIPEGLMVAISLIAINFSKTKAVLYAALTGLLQPIGAFVGILGTSFSQNIIPFGMAFAAGCMIFVIINEIIPETSSGSDQDNGSWGIFAGFLLMTFLAVVLS